MKPEKLRPLNGMIVVLDDEKSEKIGSIYVPDNKDPENIIQGTVLKVSCFMLQDGRYMEPKGITPGDKVIYSIHAGAGSAIKINKKLYRVIRHNEILAQVIE